MSTSYPITQTQFNRLQEKQARAVVAQQQYVEECAAALASHDITQGHVTAFTETTITVETPD